MTELHRPLCSHLEKLEQWRLFFIYWMVYMDMINGRAEKHGTLLGIVQDYLIVCFKYYDFGKVWQVLTLSSPSPKDSFS